ncbi:transglutaminase domain-containing protein [Polaribacter aestuariivivens]|uniref:transglutaminase domain-containing protein n=1 Tax=Polaribacter aestuariivivens TaxID=2304626 RepID=UPI003F49A0B2
MNKRKHLLLSILACFIFTATISQNKIDSYWNLLLKNQPAAASEEFISKNKNYKNSIETLITNEILRNENGLINGASDGFIEQLKKYDNYEYYVYAFWNNPFIFDSYLTTGFHNSNSSVIDAFEVDEFNNQTIKHALQYVKAIKNRDNKNYKDYKNKFATIPVIKNWQFCGVFENLNKSGLDKEYEPETYAKNDKEFNANSNGNVSWYVPNKTYTNETYQFFTNHSEYGYGVHYAQTFINSDTEKRVQLRIGNSSAFKVWLNDVLIYENTKDVGTDIDAYIVNVTLPKGTSRLLIKNAENNGTPYFIARFSDIEGKPVEGLSYSNEFKKYNVGSINTINPVKADDNIAEFFINKISANPNDFFYKYALINLYLRNQRYEDINTILNPLLEEYPKSSLLRILKTYSFSYEGDFNSVNEINRNIYLDDPDYYYSLVKKTAEFTKLTQMDIKELEVFLAKLTKATNYPVLKYIAKFVLDARNEDMTSLRETMNLLHEAAADRVTVLQRFIPLYETVFQEQEKTISEYEKVLSKKFSPTLVAGLARYYDKLDRKDDVLNMYKEYHENFPGENEFLFTLVKKQHEYKRFKESLPYINKIIQNYPYSFLAMEYMGNAQQQLGNKKEALKYYKKSLIYNNGNSGLLNKIETLSRQGSLVDTYAQKEVYKYVEANRNKKTENNYGVNILLDDRVVQLYETGSIKSKSTFLYEMTSASGVEDYKEYNLGLTGNYSILKSEIIKKDKSIVPAERTKSNFVFNGLEVGDVIHISYQYLTTGSGRFYKDYVDAYQFDSENYCLRTKYTFIAPKNTDFIYEVANGKLPYSKKNDKDYTIHTWELVNAKELPKSEDYRPSSADYARVLHISTIKSWNEIATWYSDLVRSQSIFNSEVEKKFNEIFPEKDVTKLSEEERAKRIYYYIMNNFNYSFVEFKQSGFIPQKPAKTISSKLGDCKDFSTLFATFGRKAGLDVNLVLILTSDYGKKSLLVPSQDFNHCIVKVKLNGEDQFLELTDKNLPFKSVPNSLLNATGLEIPYKSNTGKDYNLFHLTNMKGIQSNNISEISLIVDDKKTQTMVVDAKISGSLASAYFSIFGNDSYDLIQKDISDDFKGRIGDGLVLDTITNIKAKKGGEFISYTTKMHIKDKMNEMGSMTFFKLPMISHAYNADIVSLEKREYPIMYQNYENANFYKTTYTVEIPKEKKFIEIPANKSLNYKKHEYKITFESISDNQLKIEFIGKPDLSDISVEEYPEFKKYVDDVLKAKDILIGYK